MVILTYLAQLILVLFTLRRWLFLFIALCHKQRNSIYQEVGWSNRVLPDCDTPLTVLIVAPFFNEQQALPVCLRYIQQLDYPQSLQSVLLVDDGSTDDSGRIAQTFASTIPHWTYLRLPANVGKAAALNEAIRHYPRISFLVVYDADERPQPDSLRYLLTGFTNERVGGVTGRRVISNGLRSAAATYATYENLVHQHITCQAKDSLHLYPPLLGSNCAYRLTALTAVGGFRPGAALEDSDLTVRLARAGWHTRYLPQAISTTTAPETLVGYGAQHRRWARGFGEVSSSEFRVLSGGGQVSGFRVQVSGLLARLELFLFATGYLDRLALTVVMLGWLSQYGRASHARRTTHHAISLTLLTPLIQIITALWLEKSAAAYWFRLIILPFFFLLDILTASLGIGQSLLGIIQGRRLRD